MLQGIYIQVNRDDDLPIRINPVWRLTGRLGSLSFNVDAGPGLLYLGHDHSLEAEG